MKIKNVKCLDMSMKEIKPENVELTKQQVEKIAKSFIENGIIEYIKNYKPEDEDFLI